MPITNIQSSVPATDNLYRVTISFTAPSAEAAKKVHALMKGLAQTLGTLTSTAGLQTRLKNVRLDARKALSSSVRSLRRPRSGKVWKNLLKNNG